MRDIYIIQDLSLRKQDKLDISTMMTSVFRYLESTPEYQDLGVDDESEWYDRCYSDRKLRMLNSDEKGLHFTLFSQLQIDSH